MTQKPIHMFFVPGLFFIFVIFGLKTEGLVTEIWKKWGVKYFIQ